MHLTCPSVRAVPSHQPRPNLFHPYESFIPSQTVKTNGHRDLENGSTVISNDPAGILFGCLFFQPTHQCLNGLQLPAAPFLFGHLFYRTEAYWAKYLPLRLLLRLGKSMRHYPTPLLCDLDREPVFDCDRGAGVLPWLPTLTGSRCTPLGFLDPADMTSASAKPTLLQRISGLRIRLVSLPRSNTQMPGAKLELYVSLIHDIIVVHLVKITGCCFSHSYRNAPGALN
ncbi:unnamed protein product [Echinostoma caproni]|uniref:DUF3480 domain-containing protein n=1 Tax=Echinostoma caproni TaxID=27848 RepID=A0A183B6N5_9TREM|nr:unnamed protein product [Echinostoma caproni]